MQKQPSANILQNRCSYKFLDIHKKIVVLKSLFNTVRSLKACNFNKKETPRQMFFFPMSVTKFLRIDFLWLLVKMVEEFLRISNPSQICTEEVIKKKIV